MSVTVQLTKPISAHGEQLPALTLREPETGDIIDIGLPTLFIIGEGEETGMEIRQKVIAKYISKLGGIPPSSVREMSPKDYSACSAAVMGFFGTDAESAKATSSPASST